MIERTNKRQGRWMMSQNECIKRKAMIVKSSTNIHLPIWPESFIQLLGFSSCSVMIRSALEGFVSRLPYRKK